MDHRCVIEWVASPLVGMVHVRALPGAHRYGGDFAAVVERAVHEARVLAEAGFDALLLENMHDAPYLKRSEASETVAAMTAVACAVRAATTLPLGVQILAGANRAAVSVAAAAGACFVRAEGFVFGHLADEGLIESDAGELLRHRERIRAGGVAVYADIKKKHSSHAITADVDLAETARAAEFFGADGVIVTGVATGRPTSADDLRAVRAATRLPVLVGSGCTPDNLRDLWGVADAFIVGSWIKTDGVWSSEICPDRARAMVEAAGGLRREGAAGG